MAKRDFNLRVEQVVAEYMDMQQLLKDLKKDLDEGRIDSEYYEVKTETIAECVESITNSYMFWSEAAYELNKPNRKYKQTKNIDKWHDKFMSTSRAAILNQDKTAMEKLKQIIKDGHLEEKEN